MCPKAAPSLLDKHWEWQVDGTQNPSVPRVGVCHRFVTGSTKYGWRLRGFAEPPQDLAKDVPRAALFEREGVELTAFRF